LPEGAEKLSVGIDIRSKGRRRWRKLNTEEFQNLSSLSDIYHIG
jgi:hypothetical protein